MRLEQTVRLCDVSAEPASCALQEFVVVSAGPPLMHTAIHGQESETGLEILDTVTKKIPNNSITIPSLWRSLVDWDG